MLGSEVPQASPSAPQFVNGGLWRNERHDMSPFTASPPSAGSTAHCSKMGHFAQVIFNFELKPNDSD